MFTLNIKFIFLLFVKAFFLLKALNIDSENPFNLTEKPKYWNDSGFTNTNITNRRLLFEDNIEIYTKEPIFKMTLNETSFHFVIAKN